jgi:hypothetical protein
VTSTEIRNVLVRRYPEIQFPHAYNLREYMKKYYNYSFHKVSHIHIGKPTDDDLNRKA